VFDYVFSEHMIEHVSYAEGLLMLRECLRVLKPGGRIRIATPSLEVLLDLYKPSKTPIQHCIMVGDFRARE
jgi:predicted SAM-dependent methyltransferase